MKPTLGFKTFLLFSRCYMDVEIRITKNWCAKAHTNSRYRGYAHIGARLTMKIGRNFLERQQDA